MRGHPGREGTDDDDGDHDRGQPAVPPAPRLALGTADRLPVGARASQLAAAMLLGDHGKEV
jgi:hypothetical protein